jgi:ubiquinone/menaquinone biosynthesis C-methylase UbiE
MNNNISKTKEYFENPEKYLRKSYGIKTRKFILENYLFKNLKAKLKILDVGCGDGSITEFLAQPPNQIVYVDFSQPMLERVEALNNGRFDNYKLFNSDLDNFRIDEKYDVVFAIGLLAHVGDVVQALAKLTSFVKEGGMLVIQYSDYNHWISRINYSLYSLLNKNDLNRIKRSDIVQCLKSLGMNVENSYRYGFYPRGIGALNEHLVFRIQIWLFKHGFNFLLQDYIEIYKK